MVNICGCPFNALPVQKHFPPRKQEFFTHWISFRIHTFNSHPLMRDFRLPPRKRWELRSSGYYAASSDNSSPTFWDNLSVPSSGVKNPKGGTDSLSRNVCKKLPLLLRNNQEERSTILPSWPASWSSGQSIWLLIMRSRVRFPALPWEFSLKEKIPAVTMIWAD